MSEQNALNTTPRIRCTYCSRRIPASSITCPHCQHNPRAFYWKRAHVFILLGIAAVILLGGAYYFSGGFERLVLTGFTLNPNPTATETLTRPTVAVVLVATQVPATATPLPPTPTRTRTMTPPPTETATNTPTVTPGVKPTSSGPAPTQKASPIPTIPTVPAPLLLSPVDGEAVHGENKPVLLKFQPAQAIGAQEWYFVEVNYIARQGYSAKWCEFSKIETVQFPRDYHEDSSAETRSFSWRVSVVRSNQISPSTCEASYDFISAPSDPWTFYWY